jgi:hypothetical protein
MIARNDCGLVDYSVMVAASNDSSDLRMKPIHVVEAWGNISQIKLTAFSSGKVIPTGTLIQIYAIRG